MEIYKYIQETFDFEINNEYELTREARGFASPAAGGKDIKENIVADKSALLTL